MSTLAPAARRGDDALVGEILALLLRKLPLSAADEADLQMGITERVQQLQALMAGMRGGSDVGVVGLYGMGGIGKTTLAKAFYVEQAKVPAFMRRVLLHVGQEAEGNVLQLR